MIIILSILISLGISIVLIMYFIGDIANWFRKRRAKELRDRIKKGIASEYEKRSYNKKYYLFIEEEL